MASQLPYGYRWAVDDEEDYRTDTILVHREGRDCLYEDTASVAVPWDCMVEFGFLHDHDPVDCERRMFDRNYDSFYNPYED